MSQIGEKCQTKVSQIKNEDEYVKKKKKLIPRPFSDEDEIQSNINFKRRKVTHRGTQKKCEVTFSKEVEEIKEGSRDKENCHQQQQNASTPIKNLTKEDSDLDTSYNKKRKKITDQPGMKLIMKNLKIELNIDYEEESYKIIKNKLSNVCKDKELIEKVNRAVRTTKKIMRHVSYFTKLLALKGDLVTNIDLDQNMLEFFSTLVASSGKKYKMEVTEKDYENHLCLSKNLSEVYYNDHYKELSGNQELTKEGLHTIVRYACGDYLKNIKTNIRTHFKKYLVNFNYSFYNVFSIDGNERKEVKKKCWDIAEKVMMKKLPEEDLELTEAYRNMIDFDIIKDNFYFQLKKDPVVLIPFMIRINSFIEKRNEELSKIEENSGSPKKKKVKLLNVIPLVREEIPGHILLESNGLTELYGEKLREKLKMTNNDLKKKSNADKVFKTLFDLGRLWKNFHFKMMTDGVAVSLMYKTSKQKSTSDPKLYLQDQPDIVLKTLNDMKKPVAIDPGKKDLIYCSRKDGESIINLSYTQKQKNHYLKKKKYEKIRKKTIDDHTNKLDILQKKHIESHSTFDSRTVDINKFNDFIKSKNLYSIYLEEAYSNEIFRKLRLNTYINRRRNEDLFMEKFKKTYGDKDSTFIALGDWSEKCNSNLNGNEPTITRKISKLFKKKGYEVYLIDEFNTSKKCYKCGNDLRNVESYRKHRSNPSVTAKVTIWNILNCNNCKIFHNRNLNASMNMYEITQRILNYNDRPIYLQRNGKKKNQVGTDSTLILI